MTKETIEIRRIEIWSMGKICAALGVIWGIIGGLFAAVGVFVGGSAAIASGTLAFPGFAALAGLGSIAAFFIMIIFGAIGGLIVGIITAIIYNVAAGWAGGIKVKIK